MLITIVAVLMICRCFAVPNTYDGHKVLKITPGSEEKGKRVLNLVNKYGLDLWHTNRKDGSMDVRIPPDVSDVLSRDLDNLDVQYSTWIGDVQRLVDRQFDSPSRTSDKRAMLDSIAFDQYNTYQQTRDDFHMDVKYGIERFLINLDLKNCTGPSGQHILSKRMTLGPTYERRRIHFTKINKPSAISKKAIIVDGGIHAREWVSPAFVLYFINQLKNNPNNLTDIEGLVDAFDWYIVPVINVDGYRYSHETDRFWRKNRRVNDGSQCVGVDLNRNFGFQWNPDNGGSRYPCWETYSGSSAFSEPESSAMMRLLTQSDIDSLAYITVHSYGQYWLYPWGYTSDLPSDVNDLDTAAGIAVDALTQRYGTTYTIGSSTNTLYAAAGGSDDYAKGGAGIKYSYTVELRDLGDHGFLLPESQIIPTCEETTDAFMAFANYLKEEMYS